MSKNSISYTHTHVDPLYADGRSVRISSHVNDDVALIALEPGQHSNSAVGPDHAVGYISKVDIPSAVVALFASTGFTTSTSDDAATQKLKSIAKEFVDVYREAMVPRFREQFALVLENTTDDWEAKCQMQTIISTYENLR